MNHYSEYPTNNSHSQCILGDYLKWRRDHVPGTTRPLTQLDVLAPTNKHQTNISKYENLCGYPSRQLIAIICKNLKLNKEALWRIVNNAKMSNTDPQVCFLAEEDISAIEGLTTTEKALPEETSWLRAPVLTVNQLNLNYYSGKINDLPKYYLLEDKTGDRIFCFNDLAAKDLISSKNDSGLLVYREKECSVTNNRFHIAEPKLTYKKK